MKKNVFERLNELRGDRSVNGFATFLGIPQKTMDDCLKGKRKPSINLITAVCTKCNVTSDWILGIESELIENNVSVNVDWKVRAMLAERKLASVRTALKNVNTAVKELEGAI